MSNRTVLMHAEGSRTKAQPTPEPEPRARHIVCGLSAAFAFVALASCTTSDVTGADRPDLAGDALAAEGRMIAVGQCSSCHAIDQFRLSPNAMAPPMSGLLSRFNAKMLVGDLLEGMRVGHEKMPHFDFDIRETDALIAYLKSISD